MNYIIYTRCSTEDQKKGFSHDYQVNGLLSSPLCRDGNHVATYQDTATGTNFDRDKLDQVYKFCKAKRGFIQKILVYKWDRFGRNVGEAFQMIKKFKEIGVEVNCPDFDIDFQDSNWPIMLSITLGMAQSESLKISERTKDGMYTSYKLGYYPASPPVGYIRHYINNRATLALDAVKAPIVKEIFLSIASGTTAIDLFRKNQNVLSIQKNAFYHMLRNTVYTGYINVPPFKSNPACVVKGNFPPIITKDTYVDVQIKLDSTKPIMPSNSSDTSQFIAKGIIKINDNYLTAYLSKGKSGKKFGYYDDKKSKGHILNADRVHSQINYVMQNMILSLDDHKKSIAKAIFMEDCNIHKKTIQSNKMLIEQKQSILKKLELDYLNSSISADQFTKLTDRCESEINLLESENLNLTIKTTQIETQFNHFFEHLTNLYLTYTKSNNSNKTKLLKAIFPDGFSITKPDYTFRTPCINSVVETLCCNSAFCEEIKKDSNGVNVLSPVEGPKPNQLRTLSPHLESLIQALAS